MNEVKLEELYQDLVGVLPTEVAARFEVGMAADKELTILYERLRHRILCPECFDHKTVQLMLFGMMASRVLEPPTYYHAAAARRAGADMRELHAVAALALLVGGMRAYNVAGDAIAKALGGAQQE